MQETIENIDEKDQVILETRLLNIKKIRIIILASLTILSPALILFVIWRSGIVMFRYLSAVVVLEWFIAYMLDKYSLSLPMKAVQQDIAERQKRVFETVLSDKKIDKTQNTAWKFIFLFDSGAKYEIKKDVYDSFNIGERLQVQVGKNSNTLLLISRI